LHESNGKPPAASTLEHFETNAKVAKIDRDLHELGLGRKNDLNSNVGFSHA
jgi:hypothetical protein